MPPNLPKFTPSEAVKEDPTLSKATEYLKNAGIPSFILLYQDKPKQTTFKIENTNIQSALEMLITSFVQVVKLELKNNPQYKDEYANIYRVLLADFARVIQKANDEFKRFK